MNREDVWQLPGTDPPRLISRHVFSLAINNSFCLIEIQLRATYFFLLQFFFSSIQNFHHWAVDKL
jgi:hypothetical protein